jgi:hypothetical protein
VASGNARCHLIFGRRFRLERDRCVADDGFIDRQDARSITLCGRPDHGSIFSAARYGIVSTATTSNEERSENPMGPPTREDLSTPPPRWPSPPQMVWARPRTVLRLRPRPRRSRAHRAFRERPRDQPGPFLRERGRRARASLPGEGQLRSSDTRLHESSLGVQGQRAVPLRRRLGSSLRTE